MELKTIVWDVDDVLNDLTREWFESAWQQEHPTSAAIRFEDLKENPPHGILGVSLPHYLESLDRFRASATGRSLTPRADVLQWFERYGSVFRHVALTATTAAAAPDATAWVLRNFGRWFRVVAFVPSPRPGVDLPQYDANKTSFLQWLSKADFFVDDRPDNLEGARSLGIATLPAPAPWNDATVSPLRTLTAVAENFERVIA